MTLLLTAAQMRAIDRAAIDELGIPGVVLMENAGRGVAAIIARERPETRGLKVTVVAGAGQNGGDGFVIARHLAAVGAEVRVALVAPRARISGDALVFLQIAERTPGVVVVDLSSETRDEVWRAEVRDAAVTVDAIYGTGLRADVAGPAAAAVRAMNEARALCVAVDLPSGLSADEGTIRGIAVDADISATMAAPKLGMWLDEAAPVGRIEIVPIGFDVGAHRAAAAAVGPICELLEDDQVAAWLPRWEAGAHKGTRGHVAVVGGSAGKTGSALLAATAALRSGAGLCTVLTTAAAQTAIDAKTIEVMSAVYTDGADADADSEARIVALSARMKAAALGPGIPTGPRMKTVVAALAARWPLPLVIDADGLNLLGTEAAAVLAQAIGPRVLTPHPVEMSRLTGLSVDKIAADRLGAARDLAARSRAVVVLKGARTVVAAPDGSAWVSPFADPSLGTAGSGDVLTGTIAALLAQGLSVQQAACVGVYAHGKAAGEARAAVGSRFLIAGDLPLAIARAFEDLLTRDEPTAALR
ncbi:MAG TPA: NAD(P)H-hydrate dehydratase [Polyangia bacterium]